MNFFKKEKKMPNQLCSNDLIKDLAVMFKEYGDKILSEEVIFSLNASSLTYLNDSLSRVSAEDINVTFDIVPTNNSKLAFHHDLQFLYDFIQKISALKLNHGNTTLQGRFNICRFRSLKNLEIKKIPIHLVVGLQNLRPRLEAISCCRSLQNLEDLFEKCGGDLSQPFTWCELKSVNLSYNSVEKLDDSLKLLPYLEVLNLSHNNISHADNLAHLTVLKCLGLSYNSLQACPLFSNSSRGTLVSLNLCYNNLESLTGIDALYALEDLDVSGNCLVNHSVLKKIMLLKNLKSLNLTENPLSYHRNHREYSIKYLHPDTAKSKFLLDGKYLNHEEEVFVKETRVFSISSRMSNGRLHAEIDDDNMQQSTTSLNGVNSNTIVASRSVSDFETSLECSYSPMTRRKKKMSKITDAIILDPNELDVRDAKPPTEENPKVHEDHLEFKSNIKNAREKYGPDWLIANKRNIGLPSKNNSADSADTFLASYKSEKYDPIATVDPINESLENSSVNLLEEVEKSVAALPETPTNMYDNGGVASSDSCLENTHVIDDGIFYVVHIANSGDESPVIISIGSRYIIEKDSMTGKIFDELDLHSLVRYETTGQDEDSFSLLLAFDYVKKSRRERTYNFENKDQLDSLIEHLKPFILKRHLALAVKKGALQCLKCGAQFFKEGAVLKIKTVDKIVSEDGPSYPSSYNGNEGYIIEVPTCPSCESDMIVEIDLASDIGIPKRKASTPLYSSEPKVTFETAQEAKEMYQESDDIQSLVQRMSDDNVRKILNNDAVVYSSHNSSKNEFEVQAEIHDLQARIEGVDLNSGSSKQVEDAATHGERARTDSDVSILSNPSQSSIAVLSSQTSPVESESVHKPSASWNSSPETESTITGKSIYGGSVISQVSNDQGLNSSILASENSTGKKTNSLLGQSMPKSSNSFTDLDCRIKLHLSMTLFGKDEDFRGLLKAGVIPHQKPKEFEGGILISNKCVYIMKIVGQLDVENPQNYIQKIDAKDLSQLRSITILCGRQGFQLDFELKGKSTNYNVLIRDSEQCSDFMRLFIDVMENWSNECNLPIPMIHMATKETLQRINEEVLNLEDGEIVDDNQFAVNLYIMGWWRQNNASSIPVSFIFTPSDIYITEDNYEWPLLWKTASLDNPKTGQFKLLSQQKIINLKEIKCDVENNSTDVQFIFDNDSAEEVIWDITMNTMYSLDAVIKAIRIPWEELFGVDLNISSTLEGV